MRYNNFLLIALFAAMTAGFISCKKGNTQNNDAITKEVDRICDSLITATKLPGMVVGIWDEEKGFSYVKGKGKANVSTGTEMDPYFTFRIASNTKTFVVTAILQLVDEHKLSLEDTIGKFFPGFKNGGLITIKMLCNMTSGIPNYPVTSGYQDTVKAYPTKVWMPMELVNLVINMPFSTPGGPTDYSNTNTILLGMVLEKITAQTTADNLKNRLFNRLAMGKTTYPTGTAMPANSIHGYGNLTDTTSLTEDVTEKYDPSRAGAAGAIISNVYDVKNWVATLVTGNLLSPGLQSQRFIGVPDIHDPNDIYGLGMFTLGKDMWGHNGGIDGYTSIMMHHRTKKITYVIFYNWFNLKVMPTDLYRRLLPVVNPEL